MILYAGALELCTVADLEEIGLPRFAAEQIAVHFGKFLPGSVEPERAAALEEPMPEDPSELDLSEPRLTCNEPEVQADEPEPEPELEPETESAALDVLHGETKLPLFAAGKEDVNALLVSEKLEMYGEAVVEAGYSFIGDLLEAEDAEIAELARDMQMKKPEARRFLKAIAARKSATMPQEQPPSEYMCPISHELMEDPVFTASGQTYERDTISQWLRTKQTDPISNARLPNKKLVANFALRGAIEQWKEAHPD